MKVVKRCSMYADDTVIYVSHRNISEIKEDLTSDMANIAKWLENNMLIKSLKVGKKRQCSLVHSKADCNLKGYILKVILKI